MLLCSFTCLHIDNRALIKDLPPCLSYQQKQREKFLLIHTFQFQVSPECLVAGISGGTAHL